MIKLKRVYESPSSNDGRRILVDGLWPRGVSRGRAKVDIWLKDVAPSAELRRWFSHEVDKWNDFGRRYEVELDSNPVARQLLEEVKSSRVNTLLFAAHDENHNNAVVLKSWLEKYSKPASTC